VDRTVSLIGDCDVTRLLDRLMQESGTNRRQCRTKLASEKSKDTTRYVRFTIPDYDHHGGTYPGRFQDFRPIFDNSDTSSMINASSPSCD
jgi:hypothetical protein